MQAARVVNEKSNIIVAKVESWVRKRTIMKQKSKLKDAEIFIDDDYTKRESEIQKKIRVMAAGEKAMGRETKV